MNVLMYPLGPDDDFPDEFCAIRQGSGEHWFYTPVGEDASWMLFHAESENAKLRELSSIMLKCIMANERKKLICWECPMHKQFDELRSYCCLEHEAKKLGVEVDG